VEDFVQMYLCHYCLFTTATSSEASNCYYINTAGAFS
jgi:hypothetical protein